jgi:hypothetical protein
VLKIASTQSRKPCFGTFRIYDGKDVFDLSLSFKKKITLASSPGLPGLDCRLTSTPVAGKDVRNGDTEPQSYGLTLTPITAAGQTLYIPVRITGSTKGVGVTVSASYLKVDGKSVSAMLQ